MVVCARADVRGTISPCLDSTITQELAIQGLGDAGLPAFWDLDRSLATPQFDASHAAATEPADLVEKRQDV